MCHSMVHRKERERTNILRCILEAPCGMLQLRGESERKFSPTWDKLKKK